MVTIGDVAAAAGVSTSTVSLALNQPDRVSAATRELVLRAADDLDFTPKAEAVARARRGVGRVGVVGPFSSYLAAGERLAGVLRAASGLALDLVVFDRGSSATSAAPLLESLPRTGRLDGLLLVSTPLSKKVVERLHALRLPVVLLDQHHPGISSIRTDDHGAGRQAAEHLLGLGHRRLAYLAEKQTSHAYTSPADERRSGYLSAIAAALGQAVPVAHTEAAHDLGAATTAARALLTRAERPTGIFASDDLLAAGVLTAARDLGLSVPEDVAVVGCDDGDLAKALNLSTITQPLRQSGAVALTLLRDQLSGAMAVRHSVLEAGLVRRGTTTTASFDHGDGPRSLGH